MLILSRVWWAGCLDRVWVDWSVYVRRLVRDAVHGRGGLGESTTSLRRIVPMMLFQRPENAMLSLVQSPFRFVFILHRQAQCNPKNCAALSPNVCVQLFGQHANSQRPDFGNRSAQPAGDPDACIDGRRSQV